MTYRYTYYFWLFLGTVIMNLFIFFYMLKRRNMKGAIAFIITLLFSSLWCVVTAMEMNAVDLKSKLFWVDIGYIAYAFSPVSWMITVLQITDLRHFINRKRIFFLTIIPIITVILVWTNNFHGLIWQHIFIDDKIATHPLIRKYGVWFFVHAIYSNSLNLLSIIITIRFWRSKAPLYGKQFVYLAVSTIVVMIANATYILGIGPNYDMTSIALGISSLFIAWALFRNKLFDLVPIARNRVMESMTDGIVVMDLKNRIVDMNPAAIYFFGCEAIKCIGCSGSDFLVSWPTLRELISEDREYVEFEDIKAQEGKHYEASISPVKNERENLLGKLLVIRDVTEKKNTEKKLFERQCEIAKTEERERMARDLHDNLGQIMGFVNVQTQAIMTYLKNNELQPAISCLERLTEVAQEAHNSVRETIITMRGKPGIGEKKMADFFIELDRQLNSFEQNYCITVELDYSGINTSGLFSTKIIVHVLNIIKESLNNIIKHSCATTVKIKFQENCEYLSITVIDDGCGFNMESTVSNPGNKYGLLFMRERAAEIGGSLNLHSEIGKGTKIEIKIPNSIEH